MLVDILYARKAGFRYAWGSHQVEAWKTGPMRRYSALGFGPQNKKAMKVVSPTTPENTLTPEVKPNAGLATANLKTRGYTSPPASVSQSLIYSNSMTHQTQHHCL